MARIIYTARKAHNDLADLEEDLLYNQLRGEKPVLRNNDVLIYEKFERNDGSVIKDHDNGAGD